MRGIVKIAYRIARLLNDLSTLASGNPKRIGRRLGNKLLGRTLIRRFWLPWRW